MRNKFYKVEEQLNNLHWKHIAYFKKEEDANKYVELHNTRVTVYPVRIVKCEFSDIKNYD